MNQLARRQQSGLPGQRPLGVSAGPRPRPVSVQPQASASGRLPQLPPLTPKGAGPRRPERSSLFQYERESSEHPLCAFADRYNMDYWRYKPWWYQPYSIVTAGLATVVAADLAAQDDMQAMLVAAVLVAFAWYTSLVLVPRKFRQFMMNTLEVEESRM